MHFTLSIPTIAAVAAVILLSNASVAEEPINGRSSGLAIKGYDVVAYFTEGKAVEGSPKISHAWRDVTWRFSSQEHRQAFVAEPQRYAPRYGGFCSGGMTFGALAPIDPEAFVIIDGKLYLNFDKQTAENFEATQETSIARADENWERMKAEN